MSRKDTYDTIDGELDFALRASQDGSRPDIRQNVHLADILGAIDVNLARAKEAWYEEVEPYPKTMTFLRKVAALCVRGAEEFGMPHREAPKP